jgi:hypothetical protein
MTSLVELAYATASEPISKGLPNAFSAVGAGNAPGGLYGAGKLAARRAGRASARSTAQKRAIPFNAPRTRTSDQLLLDSRKSYEAGQQGAKKARVANLLNTEGVRLNSRRVLP